MARELFEVELGLAISTENGDTLVYKLAGLGIPGSSAVTDEAPIGSVYQRTDSSGEFYRKKAAGSGTDKWIRMADNDDILSISFRSETPIVATGDLAPAEGATVDLGGASFGDDDAPKLSGSAFAVNDYIIFGVGGIPTLAKISNISGNVLTITYVGFDPIAENDKFVVQYYLPDGPDAQEKQALLLYNGTSILKLADLNWNFADGINLNGWTPVAGTISSGDNVQSALQKLWQSAADTRTALGIGLNANNFGTFAGNIISDNVAAKTALQELETYLAALALFSPVSKTANAVTSAVTIDSLLVDSYQAVKWLVTISLDSNPSQRKSMEVFAQHNGSSLSDATLVDDTVYAKLSSGASFNYQLTTDVSGSGPAQVIRLRVQASAAVSVRALRIATAAI